MLEIIAMGRTIHVVDLGELLDFCSSPVSKHVYKTCNDTTERQGQSRLVCCYFKFHAYAIIRQHEDRVPTMPVYMPGEGGIKSCVRLWGLAQ